MCASHVLKGKVICSYLAILHMCTVMLNQLIGMQQREFFSKHRQKIIQCIIASVLFCLFISSFTTHTAGHIATERVINTINRIHVGHSEMQTSVKVDLYQNFIKLIFEPSHTHNTHTTHTHTHTHKKNKSLVQCRFNFIATNLS